MPSKRRALVGFGWIAVAALLGGCAGEVSGPAPAAPPASPFGATASAIPTAQAVPVYQYLIDNAATGPAPAVPGAAPGGTVRVYEHTDLLDLDPARSYGSGDMTISLLLTRRLTGLRHRGTAVTLVGDLATDTGRTSDGGKTWTYTLRDGVSWEDGSPITAAQVKYGLERTFVKDYAGGASYLQTWLADTPDFHSVYSGPYEGKSLDAIGAPDEKTLTLRFSKPRPDLPYALALPAGAPVKPSKDTRAGYNDRPFASGPYKIDERTRDKSMALIRNTAWKAETDPIRTAYPDRFEFSFTEETLAINKRLIAAEGADAAAMGLVTSLSPEVRPQVMNSPDLLARTVSGITASVAYVAINTRRITDLRVRKALMYSYPRAQLLERFGGADTGELATTISSPTLIGHEPFDLFGVPGQGDPERARALLVEAGKAGQKIVFPHGEDQDGKDYAAIVAEGLGKAGFEVELKELDDETLSEQTQNPDNAFDLYDWGWYADWPSGASHFPPLFDGRLIRPRTQNVSFFNDPAINAEMDEIALIADSAEAGRRWSQLERKILAQVPAFPDTYNRVRQLHGPKLGGMTLDNFIGRNSLNGIYVVP